VSPVIHIGAVLGLMMFVLTPMLTQGADPGLGPARLTPHSQTRTVGNAAEFVVSVIDARGTPIAGASVVLNVTGANTLTSAPAISPATGLATLSYTGTHAGTDTITATVTYQGLHQDSNSVTAIWNAPDVPSVTVTPTNASSPVNKSQTFSAMVSDAAGNPMPGQTVQFSVTGANSSGPVDKTTDAGGVAEYSYTGAVAGNDTISAFADFNNDHTQDAGEPGSSTTHTWIGNNLTLTLSAANASVDTTQTVTATLKDSENKPLTGITVHFDVTGANAQASNVVTNASGQASLSYAGTNAGTDTIHAYGDLDADSVQDSGEPVGNATMTWSTTPSSPPVKPSQPAGPQAGCTYFSETQHNLCGGFEAYWNHFGGLAIYGYPLTEEFQENGMTVQYFERARFEWHPGEWPERYDVMLGLLGNQLTASSSGQAFQPTSANNSSDCLYFAATGHNLCGAFQQYWSQFGGLAVFGMPISDPYQENGVTIQYFERQRFELHPGAWPERYDVLLGRVGAEVLATTPY
jgi:hypothetical protein